MKILLRSLLALSLCVSMGLASCSKDNDPEEGTENINDKPGDYGKLDGNLISIGSTRDITYTSCVVLGTVDFPKITSDHTYGVVYMEALQNPEFDYDAKLQYQGHSNKTDKEQYDCIDAPIMSSSADGKFEKQLVGLKPNTVYYYRAYVAVGRNVNYSKVEMFTTQDPSPEITMVTNDPTDIFAVIGTMNGVVNVGNLSDVNEDQEYGFIFTDASQLSTPDKLTYEYYEQWLMNHFETEDDLEEPSEITTTINLNGRISCTVEHLRPGKTYYYRTFFAWNDKYFYSPEVKTLTTKGRNEITVGTNKATDITDTSATLNGTVPFGNIGLDFVPAGFMISQKYSNASEFNMETAVPWSERSWNPDADVYYVQGNISEKDFTCPLTGLSPETVYHVVAFVSLGTYYDKTKDTDVTEWIYGNVQQFVTEKKQTPPSYIDNIRSTGAYPWTEISTGTWRSGNAGYHSSESNLDMHMVANEGETLKMHLTVSSESSFDSVTFYWNGSQISNSTYSGEFDGDISFNINSAMDGTFTIRYSKDGSGHVGQDCAIVSNIRLE